MRLLVRAALSGLAGVTAAAAQSLGAIKGTVLIGRPLDVLVAAQLDGDDPAAVCAEARVRFGETPLAANDVMLSVARDDPRGAGLRVRSGVVVDEPFVTVEVRIGCQGAFTRSYTLLADWEPVRPSAAVVVPAAPVSTLAPDEVVRPPPAPAGVPSGSTSPPKTPVRLTPPASRLPGVARRPTESRPVAETDVQARAEGGAQLALAAPPAPGSRLKLEPVDLEPAAAPAAGAAAQAGDPAAPEPAVPAALQQELERLRAEQQRLLMAVEALNRELSEARNPVLPPAWWGWVVAALVSLVAAAAWLLRRRTAAPWWAPAAPAAAHEGKTASSAAAPAAAPVAPAMPTAASAASAVPAAPATAAQAEPPPDETVELGHDRMLQRELAGATVPAAPAAAPLDELDVTEVHDSALASAPVATLDLAALHELWERVDFFEDLGQIADAVAALRSFVLAHPRSSEAPYLRWWQLASLHGLDVRLAQATYEQHYHHLLQAEDRGGTLLDDAALLQRLQAEWPGPQARATLEAALASQPDEAGRALLSVRSLAAFDDLITLHGVLDLLPLLPLIEPAAATPAATAADDDGIEFDFSGWSLPPSAAPTGGPR